MNILVVEPTRSYQEVLKVISNDLNITSIDFCTTAAEALKHCQTKSFQLIFVSLYLSDITGIEFCLKFRAFDTSTPLALMTSEETKSIISKSFQAGFTDIFNKTEIQSIRDFIHSNIDFQQEDLKGKVLYVEDDMDLAKHTQVLLSYMGLELTHITKAEEALNLLDQENFDLIFTDVVLNGNMNGIALTRNVRALKDDKARIPILVTTSLDEAARKVNILKEGANDYISKPYVSEELLARIRNLIHNKQLMDKVKAQQRRLQEIALTDPLTSLYNRRSLAEFIPKYLGNCYRHEIPLSVITIDIDHFKSINDNYGHAMGDKVLIAVAQILKNKSRQDDLVVRFGGEEFVIILNYCDGKSAMDKAELLRQAIEETRPENISVTASFGVTELPLSSNYEFEDLFAASDKALYTAKETGRNRVEFLSTVKWKQEDAA